MAKTGPRAEAKAGRRSSYPPRRWKRKALALALLCALAALAWFWKPLTGHAAAAAAYGAHQGCACRHISGREPGACRADFEPGMRLVTLSEDEDARSVTARFLVLARETSTYRPGQGCVAEPWRR